MPPISALELYRTVCEKRWKLFGLGMLEATGPKPAGLDVRGDDLHGPLCRLDAA